MQPISQRDWTNFERAQSQAILRALDEACRRHPDLRTAREAIPDSLVITPAFLEAYQQCEAHGVRKSMLFRALFADPTAFVEGSYAAVGPAVLDRLVQWWDVQGALEGREGSQLRIPKWIAGALGLSRGTSLASFARTHLLGPWWAVRTGRGTQGQWGNDWPHAAWMGPARLLEARTLKVADATAMIAGEDPDPIPRSEWFFDTGIAALDLRNALVFLAVAMVDRDGGRIQNRLPAALTQRWQLRRISVPDALAFSDVASLMVAGAIAADGDDPLGIAPALLTAEDRALVAGATDPEAAQALVTHLDRWVLDAAQVGRRETLRGTGMREGTFDTGFLFHVTRLERAHPELARFSDYYGRADAPALLSIGARRWPGSVSTMLASASGLPDLAGMRMRGIGNILATLEVLGIPLTDPAAAGAALPVIARVALGEEDPLDAARRRTPRVARRKGRASSSDPSQRRWSLPLLSSLVEKMGAHARAAAMLGDRLPAIALQLSVARRSGERGPDLRGFIQALGLPEDTPNAVDCAVDVVLRHVAALHRETR